ncbi:hypothetical protein BH09SUM1_BH09SUM1_08830 [soil metagenome]
MTCSRDCRAGWLFFAAACAVYMLAPHRGIQWGDGLEFTAVSMTFSVAHPTGYPLFTLLGRLFLYLPFGDPYFRMLLLCRLASAGAVTCGFLLTRRLLRPLAIEQEATISAVFAAAVAVCPPVWDTLNFVEVYSLNAFFILAIALLGSDRRAFVPAAFVQGLAVTNHLPSLCMAPLLVIQAWKLFRDGGDAKRLLLAAAAFVLPVIALYGTLPLRVPPPDGYGVGWGNPTTLSRLLTHIRGGEYGQYQFLSYIPGTRLSLSQYAAFASGRVIQTLTAFGSMIAGVGTLSPVAGLGLLALAAHGAHSLRKRMADGALTAGIAIAVGLQLAFIFTYNIPDISDYFLGVELLLAPFAIVGSWAILSQFYRGRPRKLNAAALIVGGATALFAAVGTLSLRNKPLSEIPAAWKQRFFSALPQGASVLTNEDADTYTGWYTQMALGERRDVAIVGMNFLRFPWFRQTLPPGDPRRELIVFSQGGPDLSLQAFVQRVSGDAIEPLLDRGPVYIMAHDANLLKSLGSRYQIDFVAPPLLTEEEMARIEQAGLVNFPPSALFQIQRREKP